jgi:D-amino-acid dehydrogenase
MFTDALAGLCEGMGVVFRYGTRIAAVTADAGRVTGVSAGTSTLKADAYVIALGSFSPILLRPLGMQLPIYPIKGYSLTLPVVRTSVAPLSTIMDETYKVAITRLGDRIRIGGTAEIAGYDLTLRQARRGPLERSITDLFPVGGDLRRASFWCGLRPMTPDGTPVLGRSGAYSNLFLNTGHGTLGWTMAAGSGRVLADLVSGRQPEIEATDLSLARYKR